MSGKAGPETKLKGSRYNKKLVIEFIFNWKLLVTSKLFTYMVASAGLEPALPKGQGF